MTWEWVVLIIGSVGLAEIFWFLQEIKKDKQPKLMSDLVSLQEQINALADKVSEHQKTVDEAKKLMSQNALASGLRGR